MQRPTLVKPVRDAAYYRRLGDDFADDASCSPDPKERESHMRSARIAWGRAAELGDAGRDDSDLGQWLAHLTSGEDDDGIDNS